MSWFRVAQIFFIPAVQGLFLLLALNYEQLFFVWMLSAFLATDILLVPYFTKKEKQADIFTYSFLPLLLILLTFCGIFFIESDFVIRLMIAINGVSQFFYLLNLYYHFFRPDQYQERSLYHASSFLHILAFFYASETVFGLAYYVDISLFITLPVFMLVLAGLFVQMFLVRQISPRQNMLAIGAGVVLTCELMIALSFLPSIYYVSAGLATAFFSAFSHLLVSSIKKELTRFEVLSTVLIAFFVVVLVVATATWR